MIREIIEIVKVLTIKRIVNYLGIILGYFISRITKKVYIFANPFSISIETFNGCNLSCLSCPISKSSNKGKGKFSYEMFENIINSYKKHAFYLQLWHQGEPFLNNELINYIQHANKNKFYTVVSTNGHFLDNETCNELIKSGLKKIIISVDGTSQEVYEKYRVNGNLDIVINGITNLVKSKIELNSILPFIEIQMVVTANNQHQIEELKKLKKALNLDKVSLKSAQFYDLKNPNIPVSTINKFARYHLINKNWELKKTIKNKCFRIWHTAVYNANGDMIPCCFFKNDEIIFQNNKSEKNIWKSTAFNDFRKKILKNRKNIDICTNCTE